MAKRFRAILEKEPGMGWTIARVPFAARELGAKMIRLRVKGTVDGQPFRTSLFADANGYFLLVNDRVQKLADVSLGDLVSIALEPDLEPRPAELPDDLAVLLDEEPALRCWYDSLSESMRREIGKWIRVGKSEASQTRRAQQMAERLLAAMESEHELPPLIARALRSQPKAARGWELMTQTQRRMELLGVFYYRTPDARQRRVEKLVENAHRRAARESERL